MDEGISCEELTQFQKQFLSEERNVLAQTTISKNDFNMALFNSKKIKPDEFHVYSHKIETEAKVTNQMSSGRCWLFAALNTLRVPLMKKHNLEEFELSQNHLFWCDKLERANFFLENILKTLDEETDSRLIQFLLTDPVQDGGQWDMAVNLIKKYGVMPKSAFPDSFHSGKSANFRWLLTVKLREFAFELRSKAKSSSVGALKERKREMLFDIYRIVTICLGEPPMKFDWNFRNKDKKFNSFLNLTPVKFMNEIVEVELSAHVSLINDPRHEYGKLYTVAYLGNVVGGSIVRYVNLSIEKLKEYSVKSINDGNPVWFGCDVGKFHHRNLGIMDLDVIDFKTGFNIKFPMTKAQRLEYGESLMTHAMVFTGVHLDPVTGNPIRWRVENSWGSENGDKGYYSMSDKWFDEYTYQVVVNSKILPVEIKNILEMEPIVLPPWDPMGNLAVSK